MNMKSFFFVQEIDFSLTWLSHLAPSVVRELLYFSWEKGVDHKHQGFRILPQVKLLFSSLTREFYKISVSQLNVITCLKSSHSSRAPSSLLLTSSANKIKIFIFSAKIKISFTGEMFIEDDTAGLWVLESEALVIVHRKLPTAPLVAHLAHPLLDSPGGRWKYFSSSRVKIFQFHT